MERVGAGFNLRTGEIEASPGVAASWTPDGRVYMTWTTPTRRERVVQWLKNLWARVARWKLWRRIRQEANRARRRLG